MAQIQRKARSFSAQSSRSPASGFVELLAASPSDGAAEPTMELVLRSGHRLRLSGPVDIDIVARLVAALERC